MTWVSLMASLLLVAMSRLLPAHASTLLVGFVVWTGLIVSLVHALTAHKYGWAAVFVAFGILFNLVLPVHLPPYWLLAVNLACVATFAASLAFV